LSGSCSSWCDDAEADAAVLSDWSNLHLSKLERVVVTMPIIPAHSVGFSVVLTATIAPVEVRRMTMRVPPSAVV